MVFDKSKNTHAKCPIVESPVRSVLEEVCVTISVLQRGVDVVGYALPVGQGLGVGVLDGGALGGVEAPELGPLEEVDLAVAGPDESGVHIVGDSSETYKRK